MLAILLEYEYEVISVLGPSKCEVNLMEYVAPAIEEVVVASCVNLSLRELSHHHD